jgi:hypothetical protein
MHVHLKLVLDCDADAAWGAIRSPHVLRKVSAPLLGFASLEPGGFPDSWPPGEHPVRVSTVFGVPLGEQVIAVSYSERDGARIMEDAGYARSGALTLITGWRHRLAVSPTEGGRTLYRDRLEFSAGPLTPLVWIVLWLAWQWRGRGLLQRAPRFRASVN